MDRRVAIVILGAVASGLTMPPSAAAAASPSHAPSRIVVGAAASPPMGNGPGRLFAVDLAMDQVRSGTFGEAGTPTGNSFFVTYDKSSGTIYVPTIAGKMVALINQSVNKPTIFS